MNLLCPNCQKRLTVPEQFAGQLMKCPLCAGTFNVPGLPSAAPPPEPSPPGAPGPVPAVAVAPETYGLQPDAAPLPPPPHAPGEAPAPPPSVPPAPPQPESSQPVAPPPAPTSSIGYTKSWTGTVKPHVLQWVPAVSVVLIFILQFFPWVGVYPGGVPAAWQGAWGAAFADYGDDKDMRSLFQFTTDEELRDDKEKKDNRPSANFLQIFYLLPFFLVTLVVTVGVLVVNVGHIKLPPAVEKLVQLRWTVVAGLNLVTFLFLALQLMLGYSLENTIKERVTEEIAKAEKQTNAPPTKVLEAVKNMRLQQLHRTFSLKFAVFLHILAIIAALVMMWIEKRGNRPPPRIVLET